VVNDPKAFRPVATGLRLLATVIELHREHFCWSKYPTAANPGGEGHFERLVGRAGLRESLEDGLEHLRGAVQTWTAVPNWAARARQVLVYD
jgi:uncharacterized protein YbbC (DUF1343 family)